MSRESFEAEFRSFKQRVEAKALRDYEAFVAQQDTALQVAIAAVQEMARQHGVAPVNVSGTNFQAAKRPGKILVINARVRGQ